MAVGKSQNHHLVLPCPLLGQQLFPRIDGEAPAPFFGHGPAIATGPNLLHHQGLGQFDPQQQGTPFEGGRRGQQPRQLRSQTEIRPYQSWRFAAHTDTLLINPLPVPNCGP
jgi:hypothetical protein